MKRTLIGLLALVLAGCGSHPAVTYQTGAGTLSVYTGPGEYREILQYAIDHLLAPTTTVQLVDRPDHADLAFYQEAPAVGDPASIVARVDVIPFGLYSSRWTDLKETTSWVGAGIVEDEIRGRSLPHGAKIVLPGDDEGFARGLYLLQRAKLVKLDRAFGGTGPADLAVSQANVTDSLRHLRLLSQYSDVHLREVYQQYDAIVLTPAQATTLGLNPATDPLAVEQGPDNPWARVLTAPARLAGDPRVLDLTHALESPELAAYLKARYPGANLPATA
ncbi:lipoprotein [Actinoplanes ianthinogenes]|uniref:Lipoprotein n=1 Tax=Actinoplanes ianthinogenes TaxID=122358 RepID=A0ABM7M7S9_9ACTN|nr:MetQ/NlpA family ABC transporter substrate-binding protein [Actinoplanes ianthinogenes]BCJ47666.1 lipoprotein [Actinoplanes ianthinogenes]GGR03317.1 lipoprotein [Actinoplanes ianthinogenes]